MRVFISFLFLALHVLACEACTCLFSTFKESYDRAETVVIAKVIAREVLPTPDPPKCLTSKPPCLLPQILYNNIRYKFELVRIFKGCGPSSTIFFGDTTDSSASCGIGFQINALYMLNLGNEVKAFDGEKSFFVNICQGNRLAKSLTKEEIQDLFECFKLPENQCKPYKVTPYDVTALSG